MHTYTFMDGIVVSSVFASILVSSSFAGVLATFGLNFGHSSFIEVSLEISMRIHFQNKTPKNNEQFVTNKLVNEINCSEMYSIISFDVSCALCAVLYCVLGVALKLNKCINVFEQCPK